MKKSKSSRIISHRGNINGAIRDLENRPEYLLEASKQYSVEVDVWYQDNYFFSGHDSPQYKVDQYFLQNESFLLHAKDVKTLVALSRLPNVETFYQDRDLIACTTKGRVIFHQKIQEEISDRPNFIVVDINATKSWKGQNSSVITDFPELFTNEISDKRNPFDVLVLDIDGVLTNGTKLYSLDGTVAGKRYNDRDFTAIKRFLTEGIDVVFLSGDKAVNEAMAKLRGIEFVYAKSLDGNIEKSIYVDEIRQKYGAETLAYVGDDFYDLSGMSVADLSFCPADASPEVKSFASRVLSSRGGHGVVAELFNLYFSERTTKYPHDFVKSRFC